MRQRTSTAKYLTLRLAEWCNPCCRSREARGEIGDARLCWEAKHEPVPAGCCSSDDHSVAGLAVVRDSRNTPALIRRGPSQTLREAIRFVGSLGFDVRLSPTSAHAAGGFARQITGSLSVRYITDRCNGKEVHCISLAEGAIKCRCLQHGSPLLCCGQH